VRGVPDYAAPHPGCGCGGIVRRFALSSCGVEQAENGVEVDTDLAKEAIYLRGLIINRYSAVEFAIAELVSRAFLHESYSHLGHPPFGPAKKLRRLNKIIRLPGPIAGYRDLQLRLGEFEQYTEHRNFMVHAIMVPTSSTDIEFMMYDHREGAYSVGNLQFEKKHLETLAELLSSISIEFTNLVAKMCREIPLPEV
jgi:hypothetical protein